MKKLHSTGWILAAILLVHASGSLAATNSVTVPGSGKAAPAPTTKAPGAIRDPALVKAQFDAVARHLDQGGDLLVIANVDGLVEKAAELIRALVTTATAGQTNTAAIQAAANKLPGFLKRNGFYSVRAFGVSVVPRADGLNETKSYVSRDPASANLPMWRACVGSRPRRMACLDLIPADVGVFQATAGEPAALWTMIRQGVSEVGGPDVAKSFDQALASFAQSAGVSLDAIVASLGDECFFAILVPGPAAGSPGADAPQMPWGNMSVLAGVTVKNDTLFALASNKMSKAGMPVVTTNIGPAVVLTTGDGGLLPVKPCIAKLNGYLLFGLDEKAIADAVKAMEQKNGLVATAEFKKAFAGRPMVNNGMAYSTPQFVQEIMALQERAMAMMGAAGGKPSEFAGLQKLLMGNTNQMSAAVTTIEPDGVLTAGTGTMNGRDLVAAMAAAPVGFLAAIAIPSFVKARSTSQNNACINNLRIMDAAKEQWAMEKGMKSGALPDLQGVCQYMKGNRLPVCPAGGTYSLNPIGEPPTCSHPGHALPQ